MTPAQVSGADRIATTRARPAGMPEWAATSRSHGSNVPAAYARTSRYAATRCSSARTVALTMAPIQPTPERRLPDDGE
ncbi:hypothetical protein [Streptomyces megasporus]|uniref:hypothetical protein n=1 Tax=Streptomyces megasporus TaxID=44060 RepID=UPI0012FE8319|nr:hypothetical protein [Streptomyces megasporus]